MEKKTSAKTAIGGSLISILILILSQIAAELMASPLIMINIPEGIGYMVAGVLYFTFAYILLRLLTGKGLKIPASDVGLSPLKIKGKWVLAALLLPVAVKATYLLFFDGNYVSSHMTGVAIFNTLSAGIVFSGFAAGFVEEMVFRGMILHLLKDRWNTKVAVIVPSVLFGIVHILGMNFSVRSCLLVIIAGTLVGIMFSMIALESGSVWNGAIVHAVWNIVIIGGGLAIGENANDSSVMTYVLPTKAFEITGGEFGIESSVISVTGYLMVTVIAFIMMKRKPTASEES